MFLQCLGSHRSLVLVLGFFFLGIEELAIQLEEPFSVLPLSKIVSGIGLSAEEHVQWMEATMIKNQSMNMSTSKVMVEEPPPRQETEPIISNEPSDIEEPPPVQKNRLRSFVKKVTKRATGKS